MKCLTKLATTFVAYLAVLLLNTTAFGAIASWDVCADYSTVSNPATPVSGGIWSYGHLPYTMDMGDGPIPDTTQFMLYDENARVINQPGQAWQDQAAGSVDTMGAVSFNDTGSYNANFGIDWDQLEVDLVPDQGHQVVSTVRLQVPSDGLYSVHAEFADNQGAAGREGDAWVLTDAAASDNSVLFYEPFLPGNLDNSIDGRQWVAHDDLILLNGGDSIYFASGKGDSGGDHVVLIALVEQLTGQTVAAPTNFSWKSTESDTWDNKSNWSYGILPGDTASDKYTAEDQTATFGDKITSAQTVYTNVDKTLNAIHFDNAHTYAIAGHATITLAAGSGGTIAPSLSALQGTHQLQLNVALDADTTADIATGATVEFNNRLDLNGNNLTVNGGGTLAVNNVLDSGGGSVNLAGGVVSGSGVIAGSLSNAGGAVAPGNSPGILVVDGNYTQATGGALQIEIAGSGDVAGVDYDRLQVTGTASLAGLLDVQLDAGYTPALGDSMAGVVTAGTVTGTFATVNNVVISSQQGVAITYTGGSVDAQIALRGNTDVASGDNDVDTSDLTSAIINFTSAGGTGKTWAHGDMDGDGDVDTSDLTTSIINFTGAQASVSSVPEPTGLVLLLMSVLGMVTWRRQ